MLTKRSKRRARRRTPEAAALVRCETLPERVLLSATTGGAAVAENTYDGELADITVTNRRLAIQGINDAQYHDDILVQRGDWIAPGGNPANAEYIVTAIVRDNNGNQVHCRVLTFPVTDVDSLLFLGRSGNDKFENQTDLTSELFGGSGNDTLTGGAGYDRIYGGFGDDTLDGGDNPDVIFGGPGHDVLRGAGGNDLLDGGSGDDVLFGGGGNDKLTGGSGDDTLRGNAGDDRLYGDSDLIRDGYLDGDDVLYGDDGADRLFGKGGNDELNGGAGGDFLYGNSGDDTLRGGAGDDFMLGHAGDDTLLGEGGNDRMYGNDGDDNLVGAEGDDRMYGGRGADAIFGGDGYDYLDGGLDNDRDILSGGAGRDTFITYRNLHDGLRQYDLLVDLNPIELDRVFMRFYAGSRIPN